jgi:Spy/CpxP family protein refolding chaperone
MKNATMTTLTTTLLAGSLMAAPVLAHPSDWRHGAAFGLEGYAEQRVERMADKLNLTKDQLASIRAVFDQTRAQRRELHDRMIENRKQLRALTEQGTFDENEVRRLADAQGKVTADMIVLRTHVRAEIAKLLTPQQREQLKQFHARHGGRDR